MRPRESRVSILGLPDRVKQHAEIVPSLSEVVVDLDSFEVGSESILILQIVIGACGVASGALYELGSVSPELQRDGVRLEAKHLLVHGDGVGTLVSQPQLDPAPLLLCDLGFSATNRG